MPLAGARVLVVGGVRRLGRAIALDLAAHGAAVAVSTRARTDEADAQIEALLAAGAPAAHLVEGDVQGASAAAALVAYDAAGAAPLTGSVAERLAVTLPRAFEAIDSGAAGATLERWASVSTRLAGR